MNRIQNSAMFCIGQNVSAAGISNCFPARKEIVNAAAGRCRVPPMSPYGRRPQLRQAQGELWVTRLTAKGDRPGSRRAPRRGRRWSVAC